MSAKHNGGALLTSEGEEPKKRRKSVGPIAQCAPDLYAPVWHEPTEQSLGDAVPGGADAASAAVYAGQLSGDHPPGGALASAVIDLTDEEAATAAGQRRRAAPQAHRTRGRR